jgi:sortase A
MVGTIPHSNSKMRTAERIVLAIGLLLLAFWGTARMYSLLASKAAIRHFYAAGPVTSTASNSAATIDPASDSQVDFHLWSNKRVEAYRESLVEKTDTPLAVLRIPKIELEVPVFNDTDDLTLDRGVGRILGTARLGQPGNLGIAGHRDGFFRGLKDLKLGDRIELQYPGGTDQYVVSRLLIVKPEDVSVLNPTPTTTLTLVTCFPFYYVGHAPKRYIVAATLLNSGRRNPRASKNSITTGKNINQKEKKK